jgi:hypothetical protein
LKLLCLHLQKRGRIFPEIHFEFHPEDYQVIFQEIRMHLLAIEVIIFDLVLRSMFQQKKQYQPAILMQRPTAQQVE